MLVQQPVPRKSTIPAPFSIFTAASKAQQAADWMHAQQPISAEEHHTSSAIPEETDACRHASAVLVGAL
ncbi:hypothetical protein NKH09_28390 [Mesorhizobium sp. M1339]|uniref:hypothetical protein n=1 Tax=unclassified Mesorhizobium TaxID=325217 RepID=UPI00333A3B34